MIKDKRKMLPMIEDWTDPHNEYRYANPTKLSFNEWFWFSPLCYKIITYGFNILGIILFTLVAIWFILMDKKVLAFVPGFLLAGNIVSLIKKFRNKPPKDMNFYDVHMREYL